MKLARVFKDYMVLQRQMPICVWGTCEAEEQITVRLNGKEICTAQLKKGDFVLHIPAQEAVEDALLEIGDVQLRHVDIGEVWVAGGQSNMEYMLQYDREGQTQIAEANDDHLRTYTVGQYSFPGERELGYKAWNPWDRWVTFRPENAKELPAVAVYFAKELRSQGIPVGILNCSWGGTTASAWMKRELLEADPELKVYTEEFDALVASLDLERFQAIRSVIRAGMSSPESQKITSILMNNTFHPAQLQKMMMAAMQGDNQQSAPPAVELPGGIDLASIPQEELMQEGPGDKSEPGSLYENMVKEIEGFGVRGVLWYQGESDDKKASIYSRLFTAMIGCWRSGWKKRNPAQKNLPFLFVQIAPYGTWMNNTSENYPQLRLQQQMVADTVEDAYLACIGDLGNVYDIHPKQKRPVGHRLALLARKYIYGETDILADAPHAERLEKDGDSIRIHFSHGDGLHIKAEDFSAYNGFPVSEIFPELLPPVLGGICGLEVLVDGTPLTEAECTAEGEALRIRSAALVNAGQIRVNFACTPFYQVNLFNRADIPVKPFSFH